MFCQQCVTKIDDGVTFCSNCGAKQVGAEDRPGNDFNAGNSQGQSTMNGQFNQSSNQQGFASQGYSQPNPNMYAGANTGGSPKRVSFGEAIKLFFMNYVNFDGRSTQSEYWWVVLFNFLVGLGVGWIPVLGWLVSLGLLIPGLSLSVRRLHDTGKSWVYLLMGLIPIAGFIILIVFYCQESDGDNKWGSAARN